MEDDVEITEEKTKEEDKVEETVVKSKSIEELEKELVKVTAERDKYKRERDEANSNLRDMAGKNEEDKKSEFDEIFGGMR